MSLITTIEQLDALYGQPAEASVVKVAATITPAYRNLIEASPFLTLATAGTNGLDCSPRGDEAGFVRVVDEKTLHLPDRRGNNRVDSLRNLLVDPRVAMLFFFPGSGTTLRVNGHAAISIDPVLLESFSSHAKLPRSVLVINVEEVYFQCARAILRSELWSSERHVDTASLPTPGQILSELTEGRINDEKYDLEWPDRARKTMW